MAELEQKIRDDLKAAMRSKEQKRRDAIRLILAAIKLEEINQKTELAESSIFEILNKMSKQCRDSIEQYKKAQRQDLADKEQFELSIIQTYLPPQLAEQELQQIIAQTIEETGVQQMRDMGKVMAILKQKLLGRANMAQVSIMVKSILST